MTLTGYGWATMRGLVNGFTLTDVIGKNGGGDKPADGARDILLVGMDSRTDAQGNPLPPEVLDKLRAGAADGELNTDSLIFVHIPNDGSKAMAISLPRDSYVDIPGYGKHKINSAYARGKDDVAQKLPSQGVTDPKQIEQRSDQAGAKTLINTVEKLTGSTIDNYASINLLGFNDITTAIGGVDVCLNEPVDDSYSGAKFNKGPQTIAGADALAFVRQRHDLPRGDLDRVVRQQVFMAGLAKKVLSAGTLTDPGKLNGLIDSIKKSVILDQNWDILKFAEQMRGLTGGSIEFRTIPIQNIDYQTPDDGSAVQVDPGQVHNFVQTYGGERPPPGPGGPAAAKTIVDVRNGSGAGGLAASVQQMLTQRGFAPGETGNAGASSQSVVRAAAATRGEAQRVADALGGNLMVDNDDSIPPGRVAVVLGTDYSGPGATGSVPAGQRNPSGGGRAAQGAPREAAPQQQPAPAPEPPIKADGVTCVN